MKKTKQMNMNNNINMNDNSPTNRIGEILFNLAFVIRQNIFQSRQLMRLGIEIALLKSLEPWQHLYIRVIHEVRVSIALMNGVARVKAKYIQSFDW